MGLVLYANNYKCDPLTSPYDKLKNPNQLVGFFVTKHLNKLPGVAGLFLGALFCGSLSSVSSSLNSQAAILWADFLKIQPYFRNFTDSKSLRANKLIVLVCGVISTALSFLISTAGGNLIQISSSLNGALNAPIIGLFLMGILFKFTNKHGAIAGSIFGLITSLWVSLGAFVVRPYYPKLCVSNQYCNLTETIHFVQNFTCNSAFRTDNPTSDLGFQRFYSMSYMWYTTFGIINTLIIGAIISCATGGYTKFLNRK